MCVQTGRDHAAVVGHQQIARHQERADLAKCAVLDTARCPIQHEQAAAVTRVRRLLGDEVMWEVVVE